jgi:hypothetical protein
MGRGRTQASITSTTGLAIAPMLPSARRRRPPRACRRRRPPLMCALQRHPPCCELHGGDLHRCTVCCNDLHRSAATSPLMRARRWPPWRELDGGGRPAIGAEAALLALALGGDLAESSRASGGSIPGPRARHRWKHFVPSEWRLERENGWRRDARERIRDR